MGVVVNALLLHPLEPAVHLTPRVDTQEMRPQLAGHSAYPVFVLLPSVQDPDVPPGVDRRVAEEAPRVAAVLVIDEHEPRLGAEREEGRSGP